MRAFVIGAALMLAGCVSTAETSAARARQVCLTGGMQMGTPAFNECYIRAFETIRIAGGDGPR